MGVLIKLIKTLNDNRELTSLIVSHDVREAVSIADYVYVIADGKVMEHGTPEALAQSSKRWTRQFMDGLADGPVSFHYPAPDYTADLFG